VLEIRRENIKIAEKVFSTALSISGDKAQENPGDKILLCRTWIWENIKIGSVKKAIHLLLSIADQGSTIIVDGIQLKNSFTAALVLKVKQHLTNGRDSSLFKSLEVLAALYAEILALFAYFQHEQCLEEAMSSFQASEEAQKFSIEKGYFIELIHQARTALIEYHTSLRNPYKPSEIKRPLTESIDRFPSNTIFLTSYALHELSFGLNDRVRTWLVDPKFHPEGESVIKWLFLLWSEVGRLPELGGTTHGLRALFSRAIESKRYFVVNCDDKASLTPFSGQHSLALWTTLVHFEKARGNDESLRQVIHQGLTHLPWSKSFIMLSLSAMIQRNWPITELLTVHKLLEDRELRVHLDISAQLEEIRRRGLV
jgi:hypothetical protein